MTKHPEEDTPPPQAQDHLWSRLTHGAPLAVMLAVVLYIFYQLLAVSKLIAVAILIAVILRTLLQWLQKLVGQRWIAVSLLTGLIGGFAIFLILVVFPSLVDETQQLLVTFPGYLNSLIALSVKLHVRFNFVPDLSQGLAQFRNATYQFLMSFPSLFSQIFSLTIEMAAMLILALYIAYDPDTLIAGIFRFVPRRHHQRFNRVLSATGVKLRGWIFGTALPCYFWA